MHNEQQSQQPFEATFTPTPPRQALRLNCKQSKCKSMWVEETDYTPSPPQKKEMKELLMAKGSKMTIAQSARC